MKTILTLLFILFAFFCDAQITKTEEVKSNVDREIAHIKEIFRTEMNAIAKALEIKTDLDAIHFEKLNHEGEQLKAMQAMYVPRETFEAYQKSVTDRLDAYDKRLILVETWKSTVIGQFVILQVVFFIVIALLNHFKPFAKKETTKPTT